MVQAACISAMASAVFTTVAATKGAAPTVQAFMKGMTTESWAKPNTKMTAWPMP